MDLGDRPLLNNLLVAALHGAVAREEGGDIAVCIAQQLHLQVARLRRQLHCKDGRPRHLPLSAAALQLFDQHRGTPRTSAGEAYKKKIANDLDLLEGGADVVLVHNLADALAAATPGCFEHDGVADLGAALQRFLQAVDARLRARDFWMWNLGS